MQVFRVSPWSLAKGIALSAVAYGMLTLSSIASAQDGDQRPPQPTGEPIDATHFENEYKVVAESVETTDPQGRPVKMSAQRRIPIAPRGYRSNNLGGTFLAQWMFMPLGGRTELFWGARIVSLDVQSPLRSLGLRSGDVVTRLDGTPIWYGMHQRNGIWQIPELEEHFGATDIRYINQGVNRVRAGQVVLDYHSEDEGFVPLRP